ncbi:MAG: Fe-S oxidoreductase [Desulfobulbus propionicus]|nr:MAG: Fe-S oxidoreductase [Desulfobulbus propionicus]
MGNTSAIATIFACTRCGFCCHGETTVSLTPFDQQRMADALNMTTDEVREKYWRVTGNVVQMKVVDGHCIFYDEELKGCSVHKGRPERCREWPLHPSMLADENNYITIVDSCPGLNQELGYAHFCAILEEILAQQKGQ